MRNWKLKFWYIISYSSFALRPKCLQRKAKAKALALLLHYFWRRLWLAVNRDCLCSCCHTTSCTLITLANSWCVERMVGVYVFVCIHSNKNLNLGSNSYDLTQWLSKCCTAQLVYTYCVCMTWESSKCLQILKRVSACIVQKVSFYCLMLNGSLLPVSSTGSLMPLLPRERWNKLL